MSDILIKNMKMPENCLHCSFSHMASDCLKIWIICKVKDISVADKDAVKDGRPDWCPLVEVPPHGRLIDADEMLQFLVETFGEEVKAGFAWKTISEHCITIIEAEG